MRAREELLDTIGGLRHALIALGVFSFCINMLLLMPAVYMLQVYDRVLASRNEGTLLALTALLVLLLSIEAALDLVRSRMLGRMGEHLDERLDGRIFDAAFASAAAGRSEVPAQAFADLARLREFVAGKGLLALFDAPWAPLFLVAIFLLNTTLGMFAAAAMLFLVALAWHNQRVTTDLMAEAGSLADTAQNEALARLRNIEIITAIGMLDRFRSRWLDQQQRLLKISRSLTNNAATMGSASRYARMVLQSGILGLGAWLVLRGEMSAGAMIAGSILLGRTLAPFDLLIANWKSIARAQESRLRLSALLNTNPPAMSRISLPRPHGKVSVENLVVAAPGKRDPILRNLSFDVAPGSLIGIVGSSGSGKSTLGRALLGIWRPLNGCVRLDGATIHTRDRAEIGPWLGYLPQDVELFDGTVAENIARFGPLESQRVIAAAQRCNVHEMILRMPQGYETRIGQGGVVLSGGERQRVGLARALYGDPAMIVLDEPNASLDEAGDQALLETLRTLKNENRTVFIISHRMNVLELVDRVLVMSAGTVKVFGPRDEVLQAARRTRQLASPVSTLEKVRQSQEMQA